MRRGAEVGGHDRGRAAVERERRGEHPAVPDGDELGDAVRVLGGDDRDRVGPVGGGRDRPRATCGRAVAGRRRRPRPAAPRSAGRPDARAASRLADVRAGPRAHR